MLGAKYNGSPFVLTEFGGIAYRVGAKAAENEWGYSGIEPTREAFLARLDGLIKAVRENPAVGGLLLHAADRRRAGDQRPDDVRPQAQG